ncbi:MAG TPA: VWA domain-containing protein [Thermosynechococcaceae cyanobacterium]
MRVSLQSALSDANVDANQAVSQRQLAIAVAAVAETESRNLPLNLCLILDHSGSMKGRSLDIVKQAANQLVDRLSPQDHLTVVAFDHKAKVLIANQAISNPTTLKQQINQLQAGGGTAIDEGLRMGVEELVKSQKEAVSQAFLLTDGENEHGDDDRCLKLAKLAADYNLTVNTLGFGDRWNQDVLEKIADAGGGTMAYIPQPDAAVGEFNRLLNRMRSVGLTDAHLLLSLSPGVRLAELKPIAQVAPDTIELFVQQEGEFHQVRLGDLMDSPRVVLVNLYLDKLAAGVQTIAQAQIRYTDPSGEERLFSETLPIRANFLSPFQSALDPQVQQYILALAKYRQTQIAETKLQAGDRDGAITMLQSAAKTALQMGDRGGATVLQANATRLQSGEALSAGDRKQTRLIAKTSLR